HAANWLSVAASRRTLSDIASRYLRASSVHSGAASSTRHIGPSGYSGPSNRTNVGTGSPAIQYRSGGGCLPATEATVPSAPPSSAFATYRDVLRVSPRILTASSPSGDTTSFSTRGFGVNATT